MTMTIQCPSCGKIIQNKSQKCGFCGVLVDEISLRLVQEGYLAPDDIPLETIKEQNSVTIEARPISKKADKKSSLLQRLFKKGILPKVKDTVRMKTRHSPIWMYYFGLLFFSVFLTFSFLIIYRFEDPPTRANELLSYYLLLLDYSRELNLYLLLVGLASVLVISFMCFGIFWHRKHYIRFYFVYIIGTIATITLATSLSILGANAFAFGEVALLEYKLYQHPLENDLIWDSEIIVEQLSDRHDAPRIIIVGGDIHKKIVAEIIKERQRGHFYKKVVLEEVLTLYPVSFAIPEKGAFVLYQDKLYIRNFEGAAFQSISPTLGRLLVKNTFSDRDIKEVPFIEVLTLDKYKDFRIHQINTHLRYLVSLIEKLNAVIESINEDIAKAKSNVNYYKSRATSAYAIGDLTYSSCMRAEICRTTWIPRTCGYYYVYSCDIPLLSCEPRYSPSYCDNEREYYYRQGDEFIDEANYWVGQYNYNVEWYNKFAAYRDQTKLAQEATEDSKKSIPYELGVFFPKNNIKIALSSTKASKAAEYLSTLFHEYLHYTSFVSEDKQLPKFFEESLTEYFSRKVQRNALGSELNLGYPLMTTFISRLVEDIPQHDLEDMYFSKDSEKLYAILNERFGKDFYQKNEFYFDLLPYMSTNMGLEMTNGILEKVKLQRIEPDELNQVTSLIRYQ